MSVRPPKAFRQQSADNPIAEALEQEVLEEKAGTLARLNTKLEQALQRIPKETDQPESEDACRLRRLRIAEAGEALWHVTIQRELCGLTRHKAFFDYMGVPAKVRLAAGPVPAELRTKSGNH